MLYLTTSEFNLGIYVEGSSEMNKKDQNVFVSSNGLLTSLILSASSDSFGSVDDH